MWSVVVIASVMASVRWALDGFYMVQTKFRSGRTPYRFDDRLMGQTKEQVLAAHGEPLDCYDWNGEEVWVYSDNRPTLGALTGGCRCASTGSLSVSLGS